ncbi:hypothetical protein D915_008983 [Fasciola hepatica]|uniref:G-protein coupled receptors family 1 profile domain-containing protein n=1 Tax=Fasciola hepatica TaxID=6192 RepID=A0A4E0RET3_FASHE|nr:hypothetical protein D915_008983 [Fasciola hepatica]
MNQIVNGKDDKVLTPFNHVAIWIVSILGLTGNLAGFISTYRIHIGFPATRLLIRLQYVWDTIGIIIVAIYWVTFNLNIPPEILTNSVFSSLWSSYYVAAIPIILSLTNTMLLSVDRYWAIVWFKKYRRDSLYYRSTLITIMFVWTIVITMPTAILGYLSVNVHLIGADLITIYRKAKSILQFILCLIGPSILICTTQTHILIILNRLNSGRSTGLSSTDGGDRPKENTVDDDMRALSKSIIIMMVAFFLVRFPSYFGYILTAFGMVKPLTVQEWKIQTIVSLSVNFCINPFALIFTIKGSRGCIFHRLHSYVKLIRHWCSRCLFQRSN